MFFIAPRLVLVVAFTTACCVPAFGQPPLAEIAATAPRGDAADDPGTGSVISAEQLASLQAVCTSPTHGEDIKHIFEEKQVKVLEVANAEINPAYLAGHRLPDEADNPVRAGLPAFLTMRINRDKGRANLPCKVHIVTSEDAFDFVWRLLDLDGKDYLQGREEIDPLR